jgi:hypothetical protein
MWKDVLAGCMAGMSGIVVGIWLYRIRRRTLWVLAKYDARLVEKLRQVTETEFNMVPITNDQDTAMATFLHTRKALSERPQNHEVTKSYQHDVLLLPASLMQSLLFTGGLMGIIAWGGSFVLFVFFPSFFIDTAAIVNLVVSWILSTLITAGIFLSTRQRTVYWDSLKDHYIKALHLDLEHDSIELVAIEQCLDSMLNNMREGTLNDEELLLKQYEESLRVSRIQTAYPHKLLSRPFLGKELKPGKTLMLIAVVFVASLICAGFTLIATGWVGLIGLLFSFLFFLGIFLTGTALFNIPRLVAFYLLMVPIVLWASSLYWTSLKAQYESQFQPLRALHDIDILDEVDYRREWTHGGYTQFTVFFIWSPHQDIATVEHLIQQHLDVDSLRTVRDLSLFLKDDTDPISTSVMSTNRNLLTKAYDDVWEVQEALTKNPEILKRTNYEFEISYDVKTLD